MVAVSTRVPVHSPWSPCAKLNTFDNHSIPFLHTKLINRHKRNLSPVRSIGLLQDIAPVEPPLVQLAEHQPGRGKAPFPRRAASSELVRVVRVGKQQVSHH